MEINLAGVWHFAFDPSHPAGFDDARRPPERWTKRILLPSTTEMSGLGSFSPAEADTTRLARLRPFAGTAWYERTVQIPEDWRGARIFLSLERSKYTEIYVDGRRHSTSAETIVPQIHELTEALPPGSHRIAIAVDNDLLSRADFPPSLLRAHQYAEDTQTNWNGILGDIRLFATPCAHILSCAATGRSASSSIEMTLQLHSSQKTAGVLTAWAELVCREERRRLPSRAVPLDIPAERSTHALSFAVEAPLCWDEHRPAFYRLHLALEAGGHVQRHTTTAAFYRLERRGRELRVNGIPLSLRGTVDCAVFPQTGAPPTSLGAWLDVLSRVQAYGLNHYRFHSWCPTEAAFEAADRLGVYLQVELPCFANAFLPEQDPACDPRLNRFLYDQGEKILTQFGGHPSFLLFAVGNEMVGEPEMFRKLTAHLRALRGDVFFTQGANNFLEDPLCIEGDDCWIIMRTDSTHNIRASFSHSDPPLGHLQTDRPPSTATDYAEALALSPLPLLSHEVGQYQSFPRLAERADYQGPLHSTALAVLDADLRAAGLRDLADDFAYASGKLALQCYREDVEALLRTAGMAGFQLLGLQDFPGQGTALVGMLDAFFRSKGLVAPEQWRRFCADRVLLAKFPRYTWRGGETLPVELCLYQFGSAPLEGESSLALYAGETLLFEKKGPSFFAKRGALHELGRFSIPLPQLDRPAALRLDLRAASLGNEYPLWLYPREKEAAIPPDVLVTERYGRDAERALREGRTVLLYAHDLPSDRSIEGAFAPDFWCYPMFLPLSLEKGLSPAPGSMGLLIEDGHGALAHFPTKRYAQWQWHGIAYHARPIRLDALSPDLRPIVRVIDNFSRNFSLALLFEVAAGKGRLIVSASDVPGHMDLPEVAQYHRSLLAYVGRPAATSLPTVSLDTLWSFFAR